MGKSHSVRSGGLRFARPLSLTIVVLALSLAPQFRVVGWAASQNRNVDPAIAKTLEKGEAALAARKFAEALQDFKKAYQASKAPSLDALWGMARANHGLGAYKEEIANCTDALRLVVGDPDREATVRQARGVAIYVLAKGNADGTLRNAEADFRAVLLLPHTGPMTDFYLGMTILRIGGRDDEGVQRLRASISRGLASPYLELANRAI